MTLSKHLEEVPSSHVGDKRLRRRRKSYGIFRLITRAKCKLVGKFRRR